jgi:minor curlin subunit
MTRVLTLQFRSGSRRCLSWSILATALTVAATRAEDMSAISQLEPIAGSAAVIIQQGDGNHASISQIYVAGAIEASNQASQSQTGAGNNATIVQDGSSLSALQTQVGSDNNSVIEQYGSGRAAAHIQIGDGHSATITQFGGAGEGSGVTVTQFNLGAGGR